MPYCSNCGNSLSDDARFCSKCGKPVGTSSVNSEARKQTYDGIVHKCPNCGETLNSFTSICPSCGYEIRGTKPSQTVRKLAQDLDKLTASKNESAFARYWREEFQTIHKVDEQKIELIKSFVIPTTKEDVLEFMTYALGNINISALSDASYKSKTERAMSEAWVTKLNQAYSKAMLLFGNDPDFSFIREQYDAKMVEIKKAEKWRSIKGAWPIVIAVLMMLLGMLPLIFLTARG